MTWKEKACGPLPFWEKEEKKPDTQPPHKQVYHVTHIGPPLGHGSTNTWQCSISLSFTLMVRKKVNKCWALVRTPHLNLKVNLFTVPNCPYSAPNLRATPGPKIYWQPTGMFAVHDGRSPRRATGHRGCRSLYTRVTELVCLHQFPHWVNWTVSGFTCGRHLFPISPTYCPCSGRCPLFTKTRKGSQIRSMASFPFLLFIIY